MNVGQKILENMISFLQSNMPEMVKTDHLWTLAQSTITPRRPDLHAGWLCTILIWS